jgi:rifampicin phosphotransferase
VNADTFKVRDGEVVARRSLPSSVRSTPRRWAGPKNWRSRRRGKQPALTDAQVVRLVQLGRRIEAHFGHPQDIEWSLAEGDFWIVQSRPITTLFPIPEAADRENHVYVSVGHGQMMTEAMRPPGVSVWQLTATAPMHEAGGRLFVDVTQRLASPTTRVGLLEVMGRGDPLIGDALQTILERGDFLPSLPDADPAHPGGPPVSGAPAQIDTDPAIVTELIERNRVSIAALKRDIQTKSGPALFDFLLEAFKEHKRVLGDR